MRFNWILILVLLASCISPHDGTERLNQIFDRIDSNNISTFSNLLISTRGKEREKDHYYIVSFTFYLDDKSEIVIPPCDRETTLTYLVDHGFTDRIFELAAQEGKSAEQAFAFYIKKCQGITQLFYSLNIPEVYNKPDMGDFTVFKIANGINLIYLNDISSVRSPFWQNFFAHNEPYHGNWYLYHENDHQHQHEGI